VQEIARIGLFLFERLIQMACLYKRNYMKTRMKKLKISMKKSRRSSPLRRIVRVTREPKEPTLLEKIAQVTDELQSLRSKLANAGDDLPAVGTHRIAALEAELERLWELRRQERAAPLRQTALSEEEEKVLAFPSGSRGRAS
jgi:hypothetical protein